MFRPSPDAASFFLTPVKHICIFDPGYIAWSLTKNIYSQYVLLSVKVQKMDGEHLMSHGAYLDCFESRG